MSIEDIWAVIEQRGLQAYKQNARRKSGDIYTSIYIARPRQSGEKRHLGSLRSLVKFNKEQLNAMIETRLNEIEASNGQ